MDVRDSVVDYVETMTVKSEIAITVLVRGLGIVPSKYYGWVSRRGCINHHNGKIVREHWLLPWEYERIIAYYETHREEGYRRLTYMMLDENIVAVSPATTYRVLSGAGLLKRWNTNTGAGTSDGFQQPLGIHEHWHTDIKYVNFRGTFLFLISVIDGFSRYIVHHELRTSMQEFDVQLTVERALEKHPGACPRIISDNGSQYLAKDFAEFLRSRGLQHARTSIAYPQSNGKIERFHRTASEECLRKSSFVDLEDARRLIAKYIEHYNTKRLHSALYYLTPQDFLLGRVKERLEEREQKYARARLTRRVHARQQARQPLKPVAESVAAPTISGPRKNTTQQNVTSQ
jgi:transposase InsO family protein